MRAKSLTLPLPTSFSLSRKTLLVTLAIICLLVLTLSVVYLLQVENLTQKSYLIKEYQEEIQNLKEGNLALEKTETNLLSLTEAEKRINRSEFKEVSKVSYIQISPEYLAAIK